MDLFADYQTDLKAFFDPEFVLDLNELNILPSGSRVRILRALCNAGRLKEVFAFIEDESTVFKGEMVKLQRVGVVIDRRRAHTFLL